MNAFIKACDRRNPWLTRFGLAWIGLFLLLSILIMLDGRELAGVNLWLKPTKFAISIGVYLITMAWLLGELKTHRWLIGTLVTIILGTMLMEQGLITLQAARETSSHYNGSTAFDARVFSIMGASIGINSGAVGIVLLLFLCQQDPARPAYWWGIRLGLAIFLLGSLQAVTMIHHGGHSVGAPDGGPGIPFFRWSTAVGDLRVAHFIGIHGIQALPLAGWLIHRWVPGRPWQYLLIALSTMLYAGLGLLAHYVAVSGKPVIPLN